MKYTAYAGIKNEVGESVGCFMPCDSPEDGWSKIVAWFSRPRMFKPSPWDVDALHFRPRYEWHVKPAVFQ